MRIGKYIIKPLLTEKSFSLANEGKYVFKVDLKATKNGITQELKKLYKVDATKVRTSVLPGKKRRIMKTRLFSKSSKWKKAIVTLKEGQKIDVFPKESK